MHKNLNEKTCSSLVETVHMSILHTVHNYNQISNNQDKKYTKNYT